MEAAREAQRERGELLVRLEEEREGLVQSAGELSQRHAQEVSEDLSLLLSLLLSLVPGLVLHSFWGSLEVGRSSPAEARSEGERIHSGSCGSTGPQ